MFTFVKADDGAGDVLVRVERRRLVEVLAAPHQPPVGHEDPQRHYFYTAAEANVSETPIDAPL